MVALDPRAYRYFGWFRAFFFRLFDVLLESAFESYAVCSAFSDDDRLENVAQLRSKALVLQILKKELDVKCRNNVNVAALGLRVAFSPISLTRIHPESPKLHKVESKPVNPQA